MRSQIPITSILGIDLYPKSSQIWLIKLLSLIGSVLNIWSEWCMTQPFPISPSYPILGSPGPCRILGPRRIQGLQGSGRIWQIPKRSCFMTLADGDGAKIQALSFWNYPRLRCPTCLNFDFWQDHLVWIHSYRQRNRPQNQEKNIQKKKPGESARKKHKSPTII
jgi:hypothetical protein